MVLFNNEPLPLAPTCFVLFFERCENRVLLFFFGFVIGCFAADLIVFIVFMRVALSMSVSLTVAAGYTFPHQWRLPLRIVRAR